MPHGLVFLEMMLDVVNSVYICYAMDRDANTVTKPAFHKIFEELPNMQGALVQNPDGGIAYGATELTPQTPKQNVPQQAPAVTPYPTEQTALLPSAQQHQPFTGLAGQPLSKASCYSN
eukprot:gene31038-7130_t